MYYFACYYVGVVLFFAITAMMGWRDFPLWVDEIMEECPDLSTVYGRRPFEIITHVAIFISILTSPLTWPLLLFKKKQQTENN